MRNNMLLLVSIIIVSSVSIAYPAGPSDERIRSVYREIVLQADTNKDGKLSVAECKAIYTDKAMADCTFWDVDRDGVITEDEYVQKAGSLGKKK